MSTNARSSERNLHTSNRPKIFEISAREGAELCSLVVRNHYANHASPIKQFARDQDINEHTARNIYEGRNAPSFHTLLKMVATIPELASEVRRLTGLLEDLDPEFDRALSRVMQEFDKMKARK